MTVGRALVALLLWGGLAHAQTPTVRVTDLGFGPGPRLVEEVLAKPHVVIPPATAEAVLRRDTTYGRSVVVLGRNAVVDGTVMGDVLVIAGDLHVHPRAHITGRAIAIGGGVYVSTMASVGSSVSYRDITYEIGRGAEGYELRFLSLEDQPEAAVTLPGLFGLRLPAYDRSNGVSLPFGPRIAVPGSKLVVDPRITYRSQLGRVDPGVDLALPLSSRTTISANAQRGTFTNEAWIWSTLLNSASTLLGGDDNRNYYRATRVDAEVSREWRWSESSIVPYVGARWEQGESVRPDIFATGGPWSFEGRHNREDMLRPNPPVDSGTIVSGLLGAGFRQAGDIKARADLGLEIGTFDPRFGGSRSFTQATFDGTVEFPTFGAQSLRFEGHGVVTASGKFATDHVVVQTPIGSVIVTLPATDTPRQRWVYVGGLGSIPTIGMLSRGGDQLVYLDGRYNFPISSIQLPLVGPPVVTLRSVLGGADVKRWPSLAQAIGVRVSASVAYAEYLVDPARHHGFFGAGISLAR